MLLDILKTAFEAGRSAYGDRRSVRLTVHKATFANTGLECYFLNVTNTSRNREVEITHVWIDSKPQVAANQPQRQLPKRLKPDESWETWIDVSLVPAISEDIFTLGRARLSNGTVVHSKQNDTVPSAGIVPGGPV